MKWMKELSCLKRLVSQKRREHQVQLVDARRADDSILFGYGVEHFLASEEMSARMCKTFSERGNFYDLKLIDNYRIIAKREDKEIKTPVVIEIDNGMILFYKLCKT